MTVRLSTSDTARRTSKGISVMRRSVISWVCTSVVIVLGGMALSGNYAVLANMICAHCQKPIDQGRWVEVDGRTYHAEHFLCAQCDQPIGNARYFTIDGRSYDSACFIEHIAPRCNYCGKPVSGEWITNDSGNYHSSCYFEHVAPRCLVCKRPISGEYFFDEFGMTVCADHKDNVRQCHACSRLLSEQGGHQSQPYGDGRLMCAGCRKTAVSDVDDARHLMREVIEDLRGEGIEINGRIDLRLVNQRELTDLSHEFIEDRLGVTIYEKTGLIPGVWSFKDFKICILYGLPKTLLRSVLAHELMHVWIFKNGPTDQDRQLCEGSCEYASFLVLSRNPSEESRFYVDRLRENPDPIYGEGFRKVSAMVGEIGKDKWLTYLKENSTAPW